MPTVMYSITAFGVLPKGFDLLRVMLTKQARAIARSPRHRLGGESGEEVITESDDDFWRKVGIDSPEKLVQNRLKAAVDRTRSCRSPSRRRTCEYARLPAGGNRPCSNSFRTDAFSQTVQQRFTHVTFVVRSLGTTAPYGRIKPGCTALRDVGPQHQPSIGSITV